MKCPVDNFACAKTCRWWPTCSYVHPARKGKRMNATITTQPITEGVVRRALSVKLVGGNMREFARAMNVSRTQLAKRMAAARRKGGVR